jgi:hypothetical protein
MTNLLAVAAVEFASHYDQNLGTYLVLNIVAKYLYYCKSDQLAGKYNHQRNLKITILRTQLLEHTM